GGEIKGKRAIIQGWGNVAAAAGYYLANNGVKIVGIIDRVGGLINKDGFTPDEIKTLFNNRDNNTLVSPELISFDEAYAQVWNIGAEIFIPAAASRLVKQDEVDQMTANGLEVIACGANVPFADKEIFFGSIMEYADKHVAVIPDFIANCGMARVFAYLMGTKVDMSDEAIFNDASSVIGKAMEEVHKNNNSKTGVSATAFEIALKQLV
ncbi:MAG: amino acid dehydrogenase, partial [Pedobacter sp.]